MVALAALEPAPAGAPAASLSGVLAFALDAETEGMIRRVATGLLLPHFEFRRGDIRAAEAHLQHARSPAVLIVDLGEEERAISAMERLAQVCEPQVHVVAIGKQNDVGLYRELLNLGVADYLFKPVTADLLERVLRRLTTVGSASRAEARLGKLVAVCGVRGGVGASSLAANLAGYLAEAANRRVVLIDLDLLTGCQALLLNVSPNTGLREALSAPTRIDDLFIDRAIISAGERLDLLASELPLAEPSPFGAEGFATLLQRLQERYHYVIADVPNPLDPVGRTVLADASLRLLVLDGTLLACRDAVRLAALFANDSTSGRRTFLVHAMRGRPGELAKEDLAKALGQAPDVTLPFDPAAYGHAVNHGELAFRKNGKVKSAMAQVAREISGQGSTARTFLQRLLGR